MMTKEIHGGASARDKLSTGQAFTGIARIAQEDVEVQLANEGAEAMLELNAIRLQTVSQLYFTAITQAADSKDNAAMTTAIKTWAWVTNSATRAWEASLKAKKLSKRDGIVDAALAELTAYRTPSTTDQEAQNDGNL
jgi:hypothetical protein